MPIPTPCVELDKLRAAGLSETTAILPMRMVFLAKKAECDRARTAAMFAVRPETNVFGGDYCKAEASARALGQSAAVVAALAAKCAAQRAAKPFTSGGTSSALASAPDVTGATSPPVDETPSSGPSPILLGAIAIGVGVVGLLAYRSMKRKKR